MFGKYFDLEMHIVHVKKSTKQLGAVLSILFDVEKAGDYPNPFITSLSPDLMNMEGPFVVIDEKFNTGYYETEEHIELKKLLSQLDLAQLIHY